MAYEMVMPYHLHMPSYFLETFTEYPLIYNLLSHITAAEIFYSWAFGVKVVFLVTILF